MLTKPVIDIDPDLLRRSAEAERHASEQAWIHINAESTGHVPTILETLTLDEPYAWAIMPQAQPDGSIVLPVQTTRDAIEQTYRMVRGHSDVLGAEALVDVRGQWYDLLETVSRNRVKETGVESEHEIVLLLPVTQGAGITGELCWVRMDRSSLGKASLPMSEKKPLQVRRELLALHDRYLDALRAGDVDALLALFSNGAQSAIRDYVDDTGTITGLDDVDGHRTYYQAFFDLYEVQSAELLQRVVQDWYLFAEARVEVVPRAGEEQGNTLAFHTATLFAPGREDRWIVQIGHGTDLARMSSS